MRIYSYAHFFLGLVCTLAALVTVPLCAAEASIPVLRTGVGKEAPLVISNGFLPDYLVDGKPARATMDTLVQIIQHRYPGSNITIIGVGNVAIDSLLLQWAQTENPARVSEPAPLEGVLQALSEASGGRFRVNLSDARNFRLTKNDDERSASHPVADVVYVGRILNHGIDKPAIESKLNEVQAQMSLMSERFGEKYPAMVELSNQAALLKSQIARANPSDADVQKLLTQITEVVTGTLAKLQPNSNPPEFQFHPGTNLLVVIGSPAAVDITRKVIAGLQQGL